MRILYIDIDSLRPDHLGCYGYHRNTSPNIDRVAAQGVRFENVYTSDAPCLPSRTALWSGRHGIHTGVNNHGGEAADPVPDGASRGGNTVIGITNWMSALRRKGMRTVTVSPFGERHSAFHWYAGFNEIYNTGGNGMESADQIAPVALDWLARNAEQDNWFLHVNLWDPHTPYRTPAHYERPFTNDPLPSWLTEEVRARHWTECGPHSAQEVNGFGYYHNPDFPDQPFEMRTMDDVRRMFDGYDTGISFADMYVGRMLDALADSGVLDDTAIIISADHAENLGELNIYGDHQTADHCTCLIPLIIRWPGGGAAPGSVDQGLHYNIDLAATTAELVGADAPDNWDAESFAGALTGTGSPGRDALVITQGAWSCQRAVRWGDYICIRSYHDGYHDFPDTMLFNLPNDPHEQHNLAETRPETVAHATSILDEWHARMMRTATHNVDPLRTIMVEGGPSLTRGELPAYLARLRETGRAAHAERLAMAHPREA